jgi:hypothetical protein
MKPLRIASISMAATMLAVILFLGLVVTADDSPSVLHTFFGWLGLVLLWPFTAYAWLPISPHDPPQIIFLLLLIMTGLFWGFVFEFVFVFIARKRRHDTLPAIPPLPPSP